MSKQEKGMLTTCSGQGNSFVREMFLNEETPLPIRENPLWPKRTSPYVDPKYIEYLKKVDSKKFEKFIQGEWVEGASNES